MLKIKSLADGIIKDKLERQGKLCGCDSLGFKSYKEIFEFCSIALFPGCHIFCVASPCVMVACRIVAVGRLAPADNHAVFVGCRSCRTVRSFVQCLPQGVYRPRNAQASPLYRLAEDHFDELERAWDERYEREYGFWRPVVRQAVDQFLDCGDLRCGFARIRCPK